MSSETIKQRVVQHGNAGSRVEGGKGVLQAQGHPKKKKKMLASCCCVAVVLNRFGIALLIEQLSELKAPARQRESD